jgi:type IV pilus assembly protein PilP
MIKTFISQTPRHALRLARRLPPLLGMCAVLAACGGDRLEDLSQYVKDVQARPGNPIAPLPEITPYERYTYRGDARYPFRPAALAPPAPAAGGGSKSKLRPNVVRNRETLEQYDLDSLKLVGSLNKDAQKWAIVKTSEGLIYRVKVGNHIGKNFGEITRITDKQIDVTEVVSDGLGGWVERKATLKISN